MIAAGSIGDAVDILRRLVAENSKDADAHLLLGKALALLPRRAEALEVLRHAVELRPESAQAYLTLGNALARFNETREAREVYEKALALDPGLSMAHANLAMILAAEGELTSAADHLSQAVANGGDPAETARYHYLRGKVYRQQDLPRKAEEDFERSVQLNAGYAKAYLELGLTRVDLQDEPGASKALQRAAELAPDDFEVRYQLGSCYLRAGEAERAVEHFQAAARLRPDDRNVLYALARSLRATGRTDEAEPLIARLSQAAAAQARHEPDVLKAGELNNAGVALEKEGKFDAALAKYRAALAISPQETLFRRNLALVLCRLGHWEEAIVELREVLRLAPGDAEATKALYIALDKIHESP